MNSITLNAKMHVFSESKVALITNCFYLSAICYYLKAVIIVNLTDLSANHSTDLNCDSTTSLYIAIIQIC